MKLPGLSFCPTDRTFILDVSKKCSLSTLSETEWESMESRVSVFWKQETSGHNELTSYTTSDELLLYH